MARTRATDARRARGRHLLASPRLAAGLVAEADVGTRDIVVDIGAGTGRLTFELARRAARVEAIELDPELAARLRARAPRNVAVVEGDAVRVPLPREPFRVVANLPFDRTTAVLRMLLDDPELPLERADVIVQWELACKRAAVWPSTALGVVWQSFWELAVVRRLPAACFEPAPAVDAALLRALPREDPLVPPFERERFGAFVHAGFANGLPLRGAPLALRRAARELGLGRSARARDLDAYAWATLFRAVRASR